MKEKRILVTGAGSNIGEGIIKSLRFSKESYYIVGADMNPSSPALFRCDRGYLIPSASDNNFIERLISICKENKIEAILIGANAEVPVISKYEKEIVKKCGAIPIVSSFDIVSITHNKWNTYEFLKENRLNYPFTARNEENDIQGIIQKCGFPLIIKPADSSGSRDIHIAKDKDELYFYLKRTPNPIIQEYLGSDDEEYTCGVFFSDTSDILGIISMRRRLHAGTTVEAVIDKYDEVEDEVKRVAETLKGKGPCNIQLRMTPRGAVTFEINLRFSGTTFIKAVHGFNEPIASIDHFLMNKGSLNLTPHKGTALRYWNELFIATQNTEKLEETGTNRGIKGTSYNLL